MLKESVLFCKGDLEETVEHPMLECSNPYIENFFRYRWQNYERMKFDFRGASPHLIYPGVYEGPNFFQRHISYSAWAHMLETRWLPDPTLAQGSILNFTHNQMPDGSFPGHVGPPSDPYIVGPHPESFYHADWGSAVLELHALHPDNEFLAEIYPALVRYARYFERERDPEHSFLFDVWNHFETGQEFSSRYTAIDPAADRSNWGKVFRLKGVDATVYMYNLYRTLAQIARILDRETEKRLWTAHAGLTKEAVLTFIWDPQEQMFFDVDPKTMARTKVKALTSFYPYMTTLAGREHFAGLKAHLFNRQEFWTPHPFPTLAMTDPNFSEEGVWRGKKEVCPWNGRMWPMTNSHMAEAIAQYSIRYRKSLRHAFVEFFNRWIKTMSFDSDPARPNSFEHYHPFTGTPSTKENGFNGINDYLHSWVNDIILKYVVGLRPQLKGVLILDPFPFGIELFLSNITYRGHEISVGITRNNVSLTVDGKLYATSSAGQRIHFSP